jgi:DNA-binding transcriptional regulator YiaG
VSTSKTKAGRAGKSRDKVAPRGSAEETRKPPTTNNAGKALESLPPIAPEDSTPVGSMILDSLRGLVEVMESGEPIEDVLTVRQVTMDFDPKPYGPADVLRVRNLMRMSQAVFAYFLGVSSQTVKSWEHGNRPPAPIACRFLEEIEADPGYWRKRAAAKHTHKQIGKGPRV